MPTEQIFEINSTTYAQVTAEVEKLVRLVLSNSVTNAG